MLSRNPGVTCIWTTRNYEVFDSGNGPLITVGEPDSVTWWREGREATREEVQTSIDGGFPNLLALAKQDGQYALQHLDRQMALIAERWMPREVQAE
jgi:hypothetical protein